MNPTEIIGNCHLWLGDCREILPHLPKVDLVLTDPPYGIGEAAGKNKSRASKSKAPKFIGSKNTKGTAIKPTDFGAPLEWDDSPPEKDLIDFVLTKGELAIVFGGNYFVLPPSSCWLIWDKDNTGDFADAELAWTNLKKAVRLKKHRWNGMLQEDMKNKETREHPTQKPVPIMEWCISHASEALTVADPFMGSGTTGVACANMGKTFYGIEREPKYFDIAVRRIEAAYAQGRLFA